MNVSLAAIRTAATLAGLTAALALAGCQTDGASPSAADAPKPQSASSELAASKPETPPAQVARPAAAAHDPEPMTHARAARECWMRTEKANPHQDLDKRADIVNKCIDEKLKAAGVVTPRT